MTSGKPIGKGTTDDDGTFYLQQKREPSCGNMEKGRGHIIEESAQLEAENWEFYSCDLASVIWQMWD